MTLWQEMFNQPTQVSFTNEEWNQAWNWLFCDKETATLKLTIARIHSLTLKRAGHARTAEMAVCGLMKRQNAPAAILERKMPIRKPV